MSLPLLRLQQTDTMMTGSHRLLGLLALLGTALSECPNSNWFAIDSKCYLPLPVPPFAQVPQSDARSMCNYIHPTAGLPEVFDSNDLLTVQELSQGLSTWIGLYGYTDYYGDLEWRWYSSSSSPSYTHWKDGEPNEAYTCAYQDKDGYWNSASCNTTSVKHHVVCYVKDGY